MTRNQRKQLDTARRILQTTAKDVGLFDRLQRRDSFYDVVYSLREMISDDLDRVCVEANTAPSPSPSKEKDSG